MRDLLAPGSKPNHHNGRDRPERCTGKEGCAGRSGVSGQAARRSPVMFLPETGPPCPPDMAVQRGALHTCSGWNISGRPAKGAGAFWRTAASLVSHNESSSLPPSLLAVRQNALRPDHCGDRVWTLERPDRLANYGLEP